MDSIKGRGITRPTASWNPSAAGLTIRIDDGDHPEFWIEIRVSADRLIRLARMVQVLQAESAEVPPEIPPFPVQGQN